MPLSHRLDLGPFYTVINRTMRPLSARVDGRTWIFTPGRNAGIPSAIVPFALKQHPRLGTFGTADSGESLLAIEGVTPAAQATMIAPGREALGIERLDREIVPDARGEVKFQPLDGSRGTGDLAPTILQLERSAIVMAND